MNEQLNQALQEARHPFADTRFNVCRLEIVESDGRRHLEGTVLDEATLDAVADHLRRRMPDARWEFGRVRVLRRTAPHMKVVVANLTGWQREPSWLAEQQSQVLNGTAVEILEEGGAGRSAALRTATSVGPSTATSARRMRPSRPIWSASRPPSCAAGRTGPGRWSAA